MRCAGRVSYTDAKNSSTESGAIIHAKKAAGFSGLSASSRIELAGVAASPLAGTVSSASGRADDGFGFDGFGLGFGAAGTSGRARFMLAGAGYVRFGVRSKAGPYQKCLAIAASTASRAAGRQAQPHGDGRRARWPRSRRVGGASAAACAARPPRPPTSRLATATGLSPRAPWTSARIDDV